jgi:hypothetical protein
MNSATEYRKTIGKVLVIGLLLATLLAMLLSATPAGAMVTPDKAFARGHSPSGQLGNGFGSFERKQRLNVVQCPTGGSSFLCIGTGAGDALIGRDGTYDWIQGREGDDTYDGKGGCDLLQDTSLTSGDRYLISVKDFCNIGISMLEIQDSGGNKDVLDLGGFYRSSDFVFEDNAPGLYMDGPGLNDIIVDNFFTTDSGAADSVDTFRFSDKTLTARQIRDMST